MIFDKNYQKVNERDVVVYENDDYIVSINESWLLLEGLKFNGSIKMPIKNGMNVIDDIEIKCEKNDDDWSLFDGTDY